MLAYWITLFLSLGFMVCSIAGAIRAGRHYRSSRLLSPFHLLALGIFCALLVMYFPYMFIERFSDLPLVLRIWQSLWGSAFEGIRFFFVAAEYQDLQTIAAVSGIQLYTLWGTFLLVLAPATTVTVILSYFGNLSVQFTLRLHPKAAVYVFSELNEKSYHLAADIKRNHRDAILLFADVFEENNEESADLIERAKEIGALCTTQDILTLNIPFLSRRASLVFFAIAEEHSVRGAYRQLNSATTAEEENLRQACRLARHPVYSKCSHAKLYVFSSSAQGEILLDNLPETALVVRRVERFRPLIMRTLFENGYEFLFENAVLQPDGTRAIRALILGAGGYGTEMIKALSWCCQMRGYSLSIDVADYNAQAEENFTFACPGLMENNANPNPGMPQYKITFHNGVSTDTGSFVRLLRELPRPTYVFVALGADERNIDAALTVRRVYRQTAAETDGEPFIHTIVYESENKNALENAANVRGQHYNICYIGDLNSSYSERVIINEDMTADALARHQRYYSSGALRDGEKPDFECDYFLRSSMAVTLYEQFCRQCGFKTGDEALTSGQSEDELYQIELFEHKRWCAFMFSEGHVYASHTRGNRDSLAKTHGALVPFDELCHTRVAPKDSTKKS